jgi:hypothetical protein
MFAFRLDRAFGIFVWYFAGATNTDADFERYIESFRRADEIGAGFPFKAAGLHYVEPENPMPNAKWRKRIAEESMVIKSTACLAFASPSPLVRGIVTAVNWFRPPPFEFVVASSFEEGVLWLEKQRGARLPLLAVLLEECKAELRGDAKAPLSRR